MNFRDADEVIALVDKIHELANMSGRSKPGQGNTVRLYLGGEGFLVEDYALCGQPVIVKVKTNVSQADAVKILLEIAASIEADVDWSVSQQQDEFLYAQYLAEMAKNQPPERVCDELPF
jgi:hypothetical protein